MEDATAPRSPSRTVVHGDAITWLASTPAPPNASVITSLPDVSEIPEMDFDVWRAWFVGAARAVIRWVGRDGVAIFFQSDIRHRGVWLDKAHLVRCGADLEAADLLWHKIVCRHPAGTEVTGRATYSHMLCFGASGRAPVRHIGVDVLPDAGFMSFKKAMGEAACRDACRFVKEEIGSRLVVDPFCGNGTVLAIANELGLDAIGVDTSARRCRVARRLVPHEA
ncbi:MAG: SAM-dependent methyltransferase [Polyangiaceae bacterium]|nr:SAM-dependent methyltransferase [Polyangiaceae bacterium]